MGMDIEKAVTYAQENAEEEPQHRCAVYVKDALEAGGLDLTHHPASAKDYGPTLLANGFDKVCEFKQIPPTDAIHDAGSSPTSDAHSDASDPIGSFFGSWFSHILKWTEYKSVVKIPTDVEKRQVSVDYVPKRGDVVVIQPYNGGNPNGHIAIFSGSRWISDFKQRDMWGGPGYRRNKPPSIVYRPK